MQSYTTDELAQLVGWPPSRIRTLARDGLLGATREGRRYRFGFRDLALVRTAKTLLEQGVSYARLRRSLNRLQAALPDGRPLTAIRVRGIGAAVVVEERGALWEADSGQGHLALDDKPDRGALGRTLTTGGELESLFDQALETEEQDTSAAIRLYRRIVTQDPGQVEAHINLGRLLQQHDQLEDAARHYQLAIDDAQHGAVARFNLGTLKEEQNDTGAAIELYLSAAHDGVIDAHYNLARLYELNGDRANALRHLIRLAARGAPP